MRYICSAAVIALYWIIKLIKNKIKYVSPYPNAIQKYKKRRFSPDTVPSPWIIEHRTSPLAVLVQRPALMWESSQPWQPWKYSFGFITMRMPSWPQSCLSKNQLLDLFSTGECDAIRFLLYSTLTWRTQKQTHSSLAFSDEADYENTTKWRRIYLLFPLHRR